MSTATEVHLKYSRDGSVTVAEVIYVDGHKEEVIWENTKLRRDVFSKCTAQTIFKDERAVY